MFEIIPFIKQFTYLGIFLLLALCEIGLPFPEDAILLLSGFLAAHGIIGLTPALLVICSSLLATDLFLYSIGKKYGRRILEHKRFQRLISPERLSQLEEGFQRWGIFFVFFGRHLLGVRGQVFLVSGIMKMSATRFLMADGISAILSVIFMVGIGYLGGNRLQAWRRDVVRVEYIATLIFLILWGGWMLFKYFKRRSRI